VAEKITQYLGTGRRKTSVARVRLIPGGQGVEINGKAMDEYFGGRAILSKIVEQPLALTETLNKFAVKVNVVGGGNSGQAGAICRPVLVCHCRTGKRTGGRHGRPDAYRHRQPHDRSRLGGVRRETQTHPRGYRSAIPADAVCI